MEKPKDFQIIFRWWQSSENKSCTASGIRNQFLMLNQESILSDLNFPGHRFVSIIISHQTLQNRLLPNFEFLFKKKAHFRQLMYQVVGFCGIPYDIKEFSFCILPNATMDDQFILIVQNSPCSSKIHLLNIRMMKISEISGCDSIHEFNQPAISSQTPTPAHLLSAYSVIFHKANPERQHFRGWPKQPLWQQIDPIP